MIILFWLSMTLLCVLIQGFYSMLEMAIVSLNRVRLEYLVYTENKKALWMKNLLENPTRLFSSFMLGVNIALQFGSQCSREVYTALHLNPSWAPITQILIVVILGELAPLFAARRYADSVAMFGIGIIYFTSLLFFPVIRMMEWCMQGIHYFMRDSGKSYYNAINRDEIQKNIEDPHKTDEFNRIVSHVFDFHTKTASHIMEPIHTINMFSDQTTLAELQSTYRSYNKPFFLIFHNNPKYISSIISVKELTASADYTTLQDLANPPWFISQDDSLPKILKQFRNNKKTIALVVNDEGETIGFITLDAVIQEIFGDISFDKPDSPVMLELEINPKMTVSAFEQRFSLDLQAPEELTLGQLVEKNLQSSPELGDIVTIGSVEFHILELSPFRIKKLLVKSIE